MQRPDFSMYVVHFTKDAPPISATKNPDETTDIVPLTAKERLFSILSDNKIRATRMPWTNKPAVCFTECTWTSLFPHAAQYSRYGLGLRKEFVFAAGGGPAVYMPPALLERQKAHVGAGSEAFDEQLYSFLTPFAPAYMPKAYEAKYWQKKPKVDFSHEREWRVPHDLTFDVSKVCFVVVDPYEDMAQAPKELKDAIGRNNWLIMSNWQRVEELWPVHQVPE
jgi:hypothetical protein